MNGPHDPVRLNPRAAKLTDPRALRDQVTCGRAPERTGRSIGLNVVPPPGLIRCHCTRPPEHARTSVTKTPKMAHAGTCCAKSREETPIEGLPPPS